MKRVNYNRQLGFTLIEIMVVVVIIGLLATMIIPHIHDRKDLAMTTKAKSDVRSISSLISMYKLDNHNYPTSAQGLQALISNPGNSQHWRPLLEDEQLDPWNNPYQYLHPGQENSTKFDLWSYGADGAPGGDGINKDIGNWKD